MSCISFHHQKANKMAERFVGCQIWKRLRPPEVGPIKSQKIQAVVQAGFFCVAEGVVSSGDLECLEIFSVRFSHVLSRIK